MTNIDYLLVYSDECARALTSGRNEDAIRYAIVGYVIARDRGDDTGRIAFLAFLENAAKAVSAGLGADDSRQGVEGCSFCGKKKGEARLVAGSDARICEFCTARIHQIFDSDES